jgi:thiamine kinase-like enzyme
MTMPDQPPPPDDLFDRVPEWAGRPRTVTPLEGGITNRNYKVEVDGQAWVVRSPGARTDLLGIDRHLEHQAAAQAAHLGLGPEVLAFVEPEGALVTRFLDAAPLTSADLVEHLATAAGVLRALHEGPALDGAFDWYEVPQACAATAVAQGATVPAAYAQALARAEQVRAAFAASPEPPVPCHNDLLPGNFLRGRADRLWLIDWEYAGMNDRFFDLGNFAVNNELDGDQQEALLDAYFGPGKVGDHHRARLRLMIVMSDLREAMWGVVQSAVSDLDEDFDAYAATHFDRLLTNAAAPGWEGLLEDAAGGPA